MESPSATSILFSMSPIEARDELDEVSLPCQEVKCHPLFNPSQMAERHAASPADGDLG